MRKLFLTLLLSFFALLPNAAAQESGAASDSAATSEAARDALSDSATSADQSTELKDDQSPLAEPDAATTNPDDALANDPLLAMAMAMDNESNSASAGDSSVSDAIAAFDTRIDKLEIDFSGRIQSDIRFRPVAMSNDAFYNKMVLPAGVERNQNLLNTKLNIHYGRIAMAADLDIVFTTLNSGVETMSDLWDREKVDPVYIRANALYIEAQNIFTKGLDFRIGQQLAQFGMADQFNPTNTINANDIEDPLLFGTQIANMMLRADYALPEFTHFNNWTLTAILVPFFKPAMLPNSAIFGTTNIARMPFIDENLRYRMHAQAALASVFGYEMMVGEVKTDLPEASFANMQYFFRMGWSIDGHDMAISYYNGRFDTPTPSSNVTNEYPGEMCNPDDPTDCIKGLLKTTTTLAYPKMQVLGLNFAGEIPLTWIHKKLKPIGYRLEVGIFFPKKQGLKLVQNNVTMGMPNVGIFGDMLAKYNGDYPLYGMSDLALDETPFAKWTLGLDYTFGSNVMLIAMWVHGFVDEYGAGDFFHKGYTIRDVELTDDAVQLTDCFVSNDGSKCVSKEVIRNRLGDYFVLGADFQFLEKRGLLRLFLILEMTGYKFNIYNPKTGKREIVHYNAFTPEGFSMIIFPELTYNFGNGFEWSIGGLVKLGRDYTKFGEAAAGGHSIFTRAKFSF